MTTAHHPATVNPGSGRAAVFGRVLVGVDGTEPGFEACRQAAVLAEPDAAVEAVSVVHLSDAIQVGFAAQRAADELQEDAVAALAEAGRILGGRADTRFLNGFVTDALLREIGEFEATVVAIGSHGHRRATEILIGGVAGDLLHRAPCSVLVARPPLEPDGFPRPIVVGIDGSRESDAAFRAGERLAARFGMPLETIVATRGKGVDVAKVHLRAALARAVDAHPVDALVEAGHGAGLLVIGSRGLH
ncbi:MAG TPA: universal stress protein, partial [Gaiellaceae bacterium]|nr:universal stress protein [Gaiellaceae bacterium]